MIQLFLITFAIENNNAMTMQSFFCISNAEGML